MSELWWKITGYVRIRLTAADPERALRELSAECRLQHIQWCSPLSVEFTVNRKDWKTVQSIAGKHGDTVQSLFRGGIPTILQVWFGYPIISVTLLVLLLAGFWIPSRILFIQIEGNSQLPERLILEKAEHCGLYFGCSRGALRSEQIKNRLLTEIPELSWAGVNTSGCVATISVRERQEEPETEAVLPGNIVAVSDAVVTELTVTDGTPLCRVGDAVKKGQVLISGYTDLGLCTHVQPAQGEVYGLTQRTCDAVIPRKTYVTETEPSVIKKYSVIFGKKRINFYSDSGILYTGCGKMTQIRYLRLPGGWVLPVALVEETYTIAKLQTMDRWEQTAQQTMTDLSRMQIFGQLVAGQIIEEKTVFSFDGEVCRLDMLCQCLEMIGRRSDGIRTEGDVQYDGENGERGAG